MITFACSLINIAMAIEIIYLERRIVLLSVRREMLSLFYLNTLCRNKALQYSCRSIPVLFLCLRHTFLCKSIVLVRRYFLCYIKIVFVGL